MKKPIKKPMKKREELIMTDNVPKGQEKDFYSEQQSAIILSKVKVLSNLRIAAIVALLLCAVLNIVKNFVGENLIMVFFIASIVVFALAMVIFVMFIVKNRQLKKYLRNLDR